MTTRNETIPVLLEGKCEPLYLLPGEIVRVAEAETIEGTLDAAGTLGGLPFTEEMRPFCGRKFRVFRRVDKGNIDTIGMRRFHDLVMLIGVYCTGVAHGGCDRTCRLLWHESWLRRSDNDDGLEAPRPPAPYETALSKNRPAPDIVQCQSTALVTASEPLPWTAVRQYARDFLNYPPEKMVKLAWLMLENKVRRRLGWADHGHLHGDNTKTPDVFLNLQPGEYVRVKSAEAVAATLDATGRNRGLEFMCEMRPLCGKTFRVYKRVERLVHEQTGRVHALGNTVLLEKGTCDGMAHRGCPRDCFFLVREVWLERVRK